MPTADLNIRNLRPRGLCSQDLVNRIPLQKTRYQMAHQADPESSLRVQIAYFAQALFRKHRTESDLCQRQD